MMKLARSYFLLRSRFAEDQLEASVERGICQYVILGVGLDTYLFEASGFKLTRLIPTESRVSVVEEIPL